MMESVQWIPKVISLVVSPFMCTKLMCIIRNKITFQDIVSFVYLGKRISRNDKTNILTWWNKYPEVMNQISWSDEKYRWSFISLFVPLACLQCLRLSACLDWCYFSVCIWPTIWDRGSWMQQLLYLRMCTD